MALLTASIHGVQREVELQHVHPRLAEKAELRAFGELIDEVDHFFDRQLALGGDPRGLVLRGGGREVRVRAAAAGGEEFVRGVWTELFSALGDGLREVGAGGAFCSRR